MEAAVERFLNLANRDEVVDRVLEDWLLRELRDDLVSRLTWKAPALATVASGLRVRADRQRTIEVYFLSPVGIGGKFFYDHPVGETLYSAECDVVVEYEEKSVKTRLAEQRLYWVGSGDPKGYRISEGFDELFETTLRKLQERGPAA
jgi:hypothetical protein